MHLTLWLMPLVATPSRAQEPTEEELVAEREAAAGVQRVYLTDAEWTYEMPSDTPAYEQIGPVLWRYDGQQVYSDVVQPIAGPVTYVEPDHVLTGLEFDPETYLALEHVDRYGRRWVVDTVDLALAEANLAAWRASTGGGGDGRHRAAVR